MGWPLPEAGAVSQEMKRMCRQLMALDEDLAFGCGLWQAAPSSPALSVFAYPVQGAVLPHPLFQWVDVCALDDVPRSTVAAMALQATSLAGHGHAATPDVSLGRWPAGPAPAVNSVEGRRFSDAAPSVDAGCLAAAQLLEKDEGWCRDLRLALENARDAPEAVRALASQVKGMREYLNDLPVPVQGPPDFRDPAFASWSTVAFGSTRLHMFSLQHYLI
ncbi:hypothetical protein AB1Y20_008380 [Prymnesium parvum]|uniref:Uncharacterized protein n=1 Tax=Prymnesium parvum TaxID=97485 RepID=A0AB34IUD3_PRYPA